MKTKILYIMTVAVLVMLGLSSCEKDTTDGVTRITYYPSLEVLGDEHVFVDKGSAFVDPGYYAELQGEDVTSQVEVTSDVNTAVGGVYTVTYKITNSDGFSMSGSRTVFVTDPTPSIIKSGIHAVNSSSYRLWTSSGAIKAYGAAGSFSVVIIQVEPGIFYISDFMGGYYDQYVGYGSNYAMTGKFQLNGDNTITPLESLVPGWEDSMDGLANSSVDPVSGQLYYEVAYAGLMTFFVTID